MLKEMADWQMERKQREPIERRALELWPARRDTPLRYLNISDDEVREVQLVSAKYLPRATLNISPVVTDCPCEEGPTCTAQVYLLASKDDKTRGLQLSRMNDRWTVGVVQQWWLRRDALHKPNPGDDLGDHYQFQKALHELYAEFPVCVGQLVPAEKVASTQKAQPTK
ncbi:MAG: hypothetical protein ABI769_11220 [Pseudomonadota bacterium]